MKSRLGTELRKELIKRLMWDTVLCGSKSVKKQKHKIGDLKSEPR